MSRLFRTSMSIHPLSARHAAQEPNGRRDFTEIQRLRASIAFPYVGHPCFLQTPYHTHHVTCLCSLRDPQTVLPTVVSGLQVYFDRALGANLLYRFERPQYAEMRKRYVTGPTVKVGQEREMSSIYGAEHLLRMLGTCTI